MRPFVWAEHFRENAPQVRERRRQRGSNLIRQNVFLEQAQAEQSSVGGVAACQRNVNGQPHLSIAHARNGKFEPSRQHTHDNVRLAVKRNCPSDDAFVNSEPASPQAIGKDNDSRTSGPGLFREKFSAQRWMHTENGKQIA